MDGIPPAVEVQGQAVVTVLSSDVTAQRCVARFQIQDQRGSYDRMPVGERVLVSFHIRGQVGMRYAATVRVVDDVSQLAEGDVVVVSQIARPGSVRDAFSTRTGDLDQKHAFLRDHKVLIVYTDDVEEAAHRLAELVVDVAQSKPHRPIRSIVMMRRTQDAATAIGPDRTFFPTEPYRDDIPAFVRNVALLTA